MDGTRFDTLSRHLAAGRTRRATLTGAMAALLGTLGFRAGASAQVSRSQCGNARCASDPGVCNDGCVCCDYPNGNSRCRPPGTCGQGQELCPTGEFPDPVQGCIAVDPLCRGRAEGTQCSIGKVCVDGSCVGDGACTLSSRCMDAVECPGGGCGTPFCQTTIEGGLVCTEDQLAEIIECTASSRCPDGQVCVTSSCFPPICVQVCGAPTTGGLVHAADQRSAMVLE